MNFPSFLLLLIFNITLLPEVITCIISILACLFRLGLCLFMWPISENIPDIREGNAYSILLGGVLHRSLLNLVGLYCCSNFYFFLLYTSASGVFKNQLLLWIIYISLQSCHLLLYICWGTIVKCMYIYNYYSFVICLKCNQNCSLYLVTCFALKSTLVWY